MKNKTSIQEDDPHKSDFHKGLTALVVEDNVANFILIARLLDNIGIHCEWKSSGYEVVEYADTIPKVDLVILDIRLPYEDGYDALMKLRSSSRYKNTKIIAVTAAANKNQMEKARNSNFDGFIGKPLDPDRFPDQIRRILMGDTVWELG